MMRSGGASLIDAKKYLRVGVPGYGYNEGNLMKLRFPLLVTIWVTLALAVQAQTAPPGDLPSAPSATQQQSAQPKQPVDQQPKPAQPEPPAPSSASPSTPPADSQAQPSNENQAPAPHEQTKAQPTANPASNTRPAEGSDKADSEDVPTIWVPVNEVRLIFTVTDKHGRYIKDLKRDDFKVIDDKKPVEKINSFRSETDLPLQVGLLIDASNSVRDRFKFEQEAAIEFLNSIIRPHYDEAFVVGFDVVPDVTQDFTDNTEYLSKGVRALRAGGGTAMYDALYFACRDKLLKEEQNGPVRRAIILLSDGDDNLSHVSREEAIEMAQRAEVIVYTISTNISGMKGKGDKVLERIADATGGRAFFPFQIRDVSDAFTSIQDELRSQYAMAYKPADFAADGRFRTIDVLAKEKGFRVRNRKGYYAPKAH
jgi:VWFA-related protein